MTGTSPRARSPPHRPSRSRCCTLYRRDGSHRPAGRRQGPGWESGASVPPLWPHPAGDRAAQGDGPSPGRCARWPDFLDGSRCPLDGDQRASQRDGRLQCPECSRYRDPSHRRAWPTPRMPESLGCCSSDGRWAIEFTSGPSMAGMCLWASRWFWRSIHDHGARGYPVDDRTPDQHDAYSVAAWLSTATADGRLLKAMTPDLSPPEMAVAQVEGWIRGVPWEPTKKPRGVGTDECRREIQKEAIVDLVFWVAEGIANPRSTVIGIWVVPK